jgi:uncharacterized protein (TIGR02996 family)
VLDLLLQAIVDDPQAEPRWLVLADWLEEHDDPRRAELLRLHRRLIATCCKPAKHPERALWQARIVALLAEGVKPCVMQRTVVLGEGVAMAFSFIPPGSFLMGSPRGEEGREQDEEQRRATLKEGFFLGTFPVTQAQWQAVMGNNPGRFKGDDRPVESVAWPDCRAFCERLEVRTGKRFKLPSETEWERACRAGTTTAYHTGDGLESMRRAGWCCFGAWASGRETRPVGQLPPNAWGLHDMHGNVEEWCSDREDLDRGPGRVLRGGSWASWPGDCRSAFRDIRGPDLREDGLGCRLVLCPD